MYYLEDIVSMMYQWYSINAVAIITLVIIVIIKTRLYPISFLRVIVGQLFPHITTPTWNLHFIVCTMVGQQVDLTVWFRWYIGRDISFWPSLCNNSWLYDQTLITNSRWESRWEKEARKQTSCVSQIDTSSYWLGSMTIPGNFSVRYLLSLQRKINRV